MKLDKLKLGQSIVITAKAADSQLKQWADEWVAKNGTSIDAHDEFGVYAIILFKENNNINSLEKFNFFRVLKECVFSLKIGKVVHRVLSIWAKQKGLNELDFLTAVRDSDFKRLYQADTGEIRRAINKVYNDAMNNYYADAIN